MCCASKEITRCVLHSLLYKPCGKNASTVCKPTGCLFCRETGGLLLPSGLPRSQLGGAKCNSVLLPVFQPFPYIVKEICLR